MENKNSVFISGCSSGIGYAIARHLKDNSNYHVVASCRQENDVEALQQEGFECILLDLNDSSSIQYATNYLQQHHNKLYALINNGAYGQPGAVEDLTRDIIRQQFEVNVFGTMELTNMLIPLLRQQKSTRVIQISSILGFMCAQYRGAYNASKYALEALTDTMRLELKDSNIQFSLIQPGPIESDFRQNAYLKFKQNIDMPNSPYKNHYQAMIARLTKAENSKGTLPATAVADVVEHALNAKRPKTRYRVCRITKLAAIAKRILPDRMMDYMILHADNN